MAFLKLLLALSMLISAPTSQQVPQPQCESYSLAEHTQLQKTLKKREVQCLPLDLTTEMSDEEIDELAREFSFLNIIEDHESWLKVNRQKLNKNVFSSDPKIFELHDTKKEKLEKIIQRDFAIYDSLTTMKEKVEKIIKNRAFFVLTLEGVANKEQLSVPELFNKITDNEEKASIRAQLYDYDGVEFAKASVVLNLFSLEEFDNFLQKE